MMQRVERINGEYVLINADHMRASEIRQMMGVAVFWNMRIITVQRHEIFAVLFEDKKFGYVPTSAVEQWD